MSHTYKSRMECQHMELHGSQQGIACWDCNTWFGPDDVGRYLRALARIAQRDLGDMGEIAYRALRWEELEENGG